MQRVFTAGTLVEAHLVKTLLETNSISSNVFNENAQGAAGELPLTEVWPEVWIDDDRFTESAQSIVREYEETSSIETNLNCQACGEQNPKNFEICWSCRIVL